MNLVRQLRCLLRDGSLFLPLPGKGDTPGRHRRLAQFARQDVSLARLVEAHGDAIAILQEAGRPPAADCLYGVWASESPGPELRLDPDGVLRGRKDFCSGATIVDRALVTVRVPERLLIEVDLSANTSRIEADVSGWVSPAFAATCTGSVFFQEVPVGQQDIIGEPGWYLSRPGFWNGACGPAACWAGGAAGLLDYALTHPKENPHDVVHVAAMQAAVWASDACLEAAGREIDANPCDPHQAQVRALILRHSIDRLCSEILQHFSRAYGPRPLAFDKDVSRRYQEVELYPRQCHSERDLETLGRL